MGIPGAQFRINTWREQHRMDYDPTHAKVDQLVLLLVAELELATAHAPGTESSQRPPKHPRVSKVEADAHQDSTREAARCSILRPRARASIRPQKAPKEHHPNYQRLIRKSLRHPRLFARVT